MQGSTTNSKNAGVKVIDFSEVPSDVLPLVIGLVARIVFTVQQWTLTDKRHPICLLCDEAHLYIPERTNQDAAAELGLKNFERIAKEGRKYGASLLPTRVIIDKPTIKPQSATVQFWKEWSNKDALQDIPTAVAGLRKQSKS